MDKISVADFRASTGAARSSAERDADRKDWDAYETGRARLECRPEIVSALIYVVRAAEAFSDFPTSISLASPNGHNAGLVIRLEDGIWRLAADTGFGRTAREIIHHAWTYGVVARVANPVLASMNVPHSAQAVAALDTQVMPQAEAMGAIKAFLGACARKVPLHSLAAAVACVRHIQWTGRFERAPDDAAAFFVTEVSRLGVRHDQAPHGVQPAIVTLAGYPDRKLFHEVVLMTPKNSPALPEAALAAIKNGRTENFTILQHRGVPLTVTTKDGHTLLHALAASVVVNLDNAIEAKSMAELLIGKGLDPSIEDKHGQRAADLLTDVFVMHATDDKRISVVEAMQDMLSATPSATPAR